MTIHYTIPGVELFNLLPGIPPSYKGAVIKGAEQCYIIDNFGQIVNQSASTKHVSLTLQFMEWHNRHTEIKCQHEFAPGLYARILLNKELTERIRGAGEKDMIAGQFILLTGSGFSSAAKPQEEGDYLCAGLWWSAYIIRDLIAEYPSLRREMNSIIRGYPRKISCPMLSLTPEMTSILNELLRFDYTEPGVNKFFHEKMKKLARLIIKESIELPAIKKNTNIAGKESSKPGKIIRADPFKDFTDEELGAKVGLSVKLLREGIKEMTGQTLARYHKYEMFLEASRRILSDKERVKELATWAGYAYGSTFSRGFKSVFWCTPTEFGNEEVGLDIIPGYVMSAADKYKYGSIVARYMSERENLQDLQELNKWLVLNDNHRHLFGQLLDDTKTEWTRQWFDAAGIKHNKIRWTTDGGWYRHEMGRDEMIWFYKWALVFAILLAFLIYGFSVAKPVVD